MCIRHTQLRWPEADSKAALWVMMAIGLATLLVG